MPANADPTLNIQFPHERVDPNLKMPVPPPAGALSVAFRVLYLHCLRAKARGVQAHACVWSPSSSKCEYCTGQHSPCVSLPWFLDEEYRALVAAEAALPVVAANVVAAAAEANRVALVAAQSVPKFCSAAERDSYKEARATRAAIEEGFAVSMPLLSVLFQN
ncbi:hypothetical protein GMDG_02855 [Pseudogymnoascus destructans 20631-21]|uniref:Uncharacterized protein n=1 Tax=Pseudogymnoascus destructans (strain ATCC MYA-4855 / 20631-21) TaxID=658429 RepID=L8G4F4_PSED2|nr:hypothetical protein GMDG_02855 [Pseudogymnoascus destructans 20631-21]